VSAFGGVGPKTPEMSESVKIDQPWVHTHSCVLPAPPSRVFRALTDATELRRWFAEHVEVDPRPEGAYRFWGRHTYGTPSEAGAGQHLTRFEPDRALAIQWIFDGAETEASIELESGDTDERTQLTLRHRFPARPPEPDGADLVDDMWRLTFGNLDAHLRGGEGIVLIDHSDPAPEVRASILIDAPPERVFSALMDPGALDQWIAGAAAVEPRIGGRYTYGWRYTVGDREVVGGPTRILDLVENERLVTDWPDWRGDESKPPTRVAWLLERVGTQTRVTVVHGTFPRAADVGDYPFGWQDFLGKLKSLVEK